MPATGLQNILKRPLIFVSGKGGTGKTAVSQAIARSLPGRVLWICFEDPTRPPGALTQVGPSLWQLNASAGPAFAEYAQIKIGVKFLAQVFLQNRVIQYLATAAPGIRELVLLGKVWFERRHYDHIVCDMPSTGYGIAMFRSTGNFATLFGSGPVHRDAEAMNATFADPSLTGHLIVSLPEEMPLQESLELRTFLLDLFPGNEPALICNRLMPALPGTEALSDLDQGSPLPRDARDFLRRRSLLERENIERSWTRQGFQYFPLPFVAPEPGREHEHLVERLSTLLLESSR